MFPGFLNSIFNSSWTRFIILASLLLGIFMLMGVEQTGAMQAVPNQITGVFHQALEPTIAAAATIYVPQPGMPLQTKNLFHPNEGCNWAGVGGQVFDASSVPVRNLVIEMDGVVNGRAIFSLATTGSAPTYGPGGYEFTFASGPVNTQDALWLTVYDLRGNRLSEPLYFDTSSDCDHTLVLINYMAVGTQPTSTLTSLPPTITPTSTSLPLVTSTATSTNPTLSPTRIPGTVTSTATSVPGAYKYIPQSGAPKYTNNTFHSEKGCAWAGISGQIFGLDGNPVQKLVVEMGGVLNANNVFKLTLSGNAPIVGPGGFDFQISTNPVRTQGSLYLSVYDLAGRRLSDKVYFGTYDDCNRNQVLFNFIESGSQPTVTTPPAATSTPTSPQTPTRTPTLSKTPTPSRTPTPIPVGVTYMLQPGSPVYQKNFSHPDLGCNWNGVVGQVFGKDGLPVKQIVVELGGKLNGINQSVLGLTGNNPAYGPGGFELGINTTPTASQNSLWLVLYDLAGKKLTEQIYFNTYGDCEHNLAVINFTQK